MRTVRRLATLATLGAIAGAAAALLAVAAPAGAQTPPGVEHIDTYDVTITIEPDGDLRVREEIGYDFGVLARHGIYRNIPYRFRYEPLDDRARERYGDRYDRIMPIDEITVSSPSGAPDDVDVTREMGDVSIRIGDPDVEVTGRQEYVMEYRVRGALNGFPDHDELYWNAVGVDWTVPIDAVDVTVAAPGRIVDIACYRGPQGANTPCTRAERARDRRTATFADRRLFPYEGVAVVVALPKHVVVPEPAPILDERWSFGRAFTSDALHLGLAGFFGLVGIAGVLLVAWTVGRDRERSGSATDAAFATIANASETAQAERVGLLERMEAPVEFVPPDDLRPGLVGTLVDEVAHPLDVTATIVDLAVRGFVRIEEIERPGLFRKGDWRLVRLAREEEHRLLGYERHLLDGLFGPGDTVELSDLRNTFATRMHAVQGMLYDEMVARGWFVRRPDKVRTFWRAMGVVAVVAAVAALVALVVFTTFGWVGVALVVVAVVFAASAKRMPRRTPAGRAALRRVVGFRRFIEESEEGERARFAEQAHLFTDYLPYAIVFGATERWARAFGDLADKADTSWYVSDRPFSAALIADSMGDFTVSTAGALTSTPAGSGGSGLSGFSGGGFSGGGGGGGGGGSW